MFRKLYVLQSSILRNVKQGISFAFSRHLLTTNVAISLLLSGAGDVIQQQYRIRNLEQKYWDKLRTKNMTCTGITVGVVCHYWYQMLDLRIPGKSFKCIVKKLAADQFIFSPICIAIFIVTLNILQNTDDTLLNIVEKKKPTKMESVSNEMKTHENNIFYKSLKLYIADMLLWPPAQLINFYFLSTQYRVLFDNSVSLLYDIYASHVCFTKSK